jgi:ribosome-associated protein
MPDERADGEGGRAREPGVKETVLGIAELLRDNRARDIVVLDLDSLASFTDFFVICTVKTAVQSKALVRFIEERMEGSGIRPVNRVSSFDSLWVLLDFNFFIVHIFQKEARDYYQLEKLWCDAKVAYSHEGEFL